LLPGLLALAVFAVAQGSDLVQADPGNTPIASAAEDASADEDDTEQDGVAASRGEEDIVVARGSRVGILSRLLGVSRLSGRGSVTVRDLPVGNGGAGTPTRPAPMAAPGGSSRSVSLLSTGRPWSLPSRPWASPSNPW